jgi:hypothetical protein
MSEHMGVNMDSENHHPSICCFEQTYSICIPQPAQVALEQYLQATLKHMIYLVYWLRRYFNVLCFGLIDDW